MVAADVGGLRTAVLDGVTGVLVDGHDPRDYADAIGRLLEDDGLRDEMSRAGAEHAPQFGWEVTARGTLEAYSAAAEMMRADARRPPGDENAPTPTNRGSRDRAHLPCGGAARLG